MKIRIFASVVMGVGVCIVLLGALMDLSAPVQAGFQPGQDFDHLLTRRSQGGTILLPPTLTPNYDGLARAGGLVSRRFDLANGSNTTDTFTLEAHSEHGWTVVTGDGLRIGPRAVADVYTLVVVPAGAPIGAVDRTVITATSGISPALWTTAMITLTVRPAVYVTIEPSEHKLGLPNQVISFTHVVTNQGADTVFVFFEAASAHGWQVEAQPTFSVMDANETNTLKIDAALPANAPLNITGEIVVTVTAHSATTVATTVVIDTITIQGSRLFLPVVLRGF
jgi:hypothetical protein